MFGNNNRQPSAPQFSQPGAPSFMPPVIKWLLIANVAVFVVQFFNLNVYGQIFEIGALWPVDHVLYRPWQYFTTMFLHGDIFHLFLNMFVLWMFGMEIAGRWGTRKFLAFYLISGLGASLLHSLITAIQHGQAPAVGASGAIAGVMIAFALLYPNRMILIFFFIPMRAKWAALLYIAYTVYKGFENNPGDNIAHFAHLGGAIAGFLIFKTGLHEKVAKLFGDTNTTPVSQIPPPPSRPIARPPAGSPQRQNARIIDANFQDIPRTESRSGPKNYDFGDQQERVDAILDKINREGWNALNAEERQILVDASKEGS